MNIAIIGGGASGLVAGIEAARAGAKVTIIEHTDKLGKKILSTGNGKCNYTNTDIQAKYFHLGEKDLAYFIIKDIGYAGIVDFFAGLGIEPYLRDGYAYPKSEQAIAVLDALLLETQRLGIRIHLRTKIATIRPIFGGFVLKGESLGELKKAIPQTKQSTKPYSATFEKIIMATGSKAFPLSGSDGSGLDLLRDFRIRCKPFLPALTSLYASDSKFFKEVGGVRAKARLHLFVDGTQVEFEEGELQFTEYGLSGIPIFQLSRYASIAIHEKKAVKIRIDLFPEEKDVLQYFKKRHKKTNLVNAKDFGIGLVNQKLWTAILKRAKIAENAKLHYEQTMQDLAKSVENLTFCISRTADEQKAQICTGGIDWSEIDAHSMELKKIKGIYVVGEMVDIDGICGGYNLTWAWCSGIVAARKAVLGDSN